MLHVSVEVSDFIIGAYNYLANYLSNSGDEEDKVHTDKLKKYIAKIKNNKVNKDDFEYFPNYKESLIFEEHNEEILDLIKKLKKDHSILNNLNNNFFRNVTKQNAGSLMFKFLKKSLYETRRFQKREDGNIIPYDRVYVTKNDVFL